MKPGKTSSSYVWRHPATATPGPVGQWANAAAGWPCPAGEGQGRTGVKTTTAHRPARARARGRLPGLWLARGTVRHNTKEAHPISDATRVIIRAKLRSYLVLKLFRF